MRSESIHLHASVDGAIGVEQTRADDVVCSGHNGVQLRPVDTLFEAGSRQPMKLAARGTPEAIDCLITGVRASCGAYLVVNRIHSLFCEVAHAGSGKGNALKFVAPRLGIPRGETVATGDNPNDVSMLTWAGLDIVVGGAPEDVREVSNWVVNNGAQDSFCDAFAGCWTRTRADSGVGDYRMRPTSGTAGDSPAGAHNFVQGGEE